MKQDISRTKRNAAYARPLDTIMKKTKKGVATKKKEFVSKAYSAIDIAAKHKVIHANKAKRLKRHVSRLVTSPS